MLPLNTTFLPSILISALIIAMLLYYFFNRQQQRGLQHALTAQHLKQQAAQLLNALAILKQLECPATLNELLNQEALQLLTQIDRLNPAIGLIEKLHKQSRIGAVPQQRIHLDSDRSLQKAQLAIRFAGHYIRQRRNSGSIPKAAYDEARRQLQWLDGKTLIDTHIKIGKRLLDNNKPIVATRRFRRAKTAIGRLSSTPYRQQRMSQVNQLIEQSITLGSEQSRRHRQP